MSIRLDDVAKWSKWDLPKDLAEAVNKSYSAPEQAIGALQGTREWLITHAPQDEKRITALFHAKIEELGNPKECGKLTNIILGPFEPGKIPLYILSPVLLPVFAVVDAVVAGIELTSLLLVMKMLAADPEAVQAMQKLDILLPQEITPKNCTLLGKLIEAQCKENLPESAILKKCAEKAYAALQNKDEAYKMLIPQPWIDEFQRIVQTPQIKARLRMSRIVLPPITRENICQIGEELEKRAEVSGYLKQTLALIEKELEPLGKATEEMIMGLHSEEIAPSQADSTTTPEEPPTKKQRISEST
jgi:hypothetical protein